MDPSEARRQIGQRWPTDYGTPDSYTFASISCFAGHKQQHCNHKTAAKYISREFVVRR